MKKIAIILFSLTLIFSSCDKKDDTVVLDTTLDTILDTISDTIPELIPTVVKTDPRPKNVVLENFTGVRCGFCPEGHAILQGILDANPGRAFGVACHPGNGSFNTPYGTDEDLRRTFLNAYWTSGFAGYLAMPTAMVGRRVWPNGNRSQSRSKWGGYANTIMAESSPVNIGVTSELVGDTLIIDVEVYYTDSVTNGHALYCYLTESDIITKQAGGGDNYVHKRVFRECFSGQWGNELNIEKKVGTFVRETYKYLYTTSNYNMAKCQILVFIRDAVTEEIITGNSANVGESTEGPA